MEHSHPLQTFDAVRPWRTATLVASAIAACELLLLVVLGIALIAKPLSERADKAAAAKLAVPLPKPKQDSPVKLRASAKPSLGRQATRVTVLNGNGQQGAAAAQAGRIRQHGYAIGAVTNAPNTDYTRTLVMYRGRFRPEAVRLAKDLGIKIVTPLDGLSAATLEGAHVAVILGA